MAEPKNIIVTCCGNTEPWLNCVSKSINCGICVYPQTLGTQANTGLSVLTLLEDEDVITALDFDTCPCGPNPRYESRGDCWPESGMPPFPPFNQCDKTPPIFQNGQGYSCSASKREHPNDALFNSQTVIKYRVEHYPFFPTCYLKVWVSKITQKIRYVYCPTDDDNCRLCEENDGPPIETDDSVYVWESQSCDYDPEEDLSKCEYTIYGPENTITAGLNENVDIKIKKYSYVKDYEPEDPDQNGEQPCRPNGWPLIQC
jgi:hypothetical protein